MANLPDGLVTSQTIAERDGAMKAAFDSEDIDPISATFARRFAAIDAIDAEQLAMCHALGLKLSSYAIVGWSRGMATVLTLRDRGTGEKFSIARMPDGEIVGPNWS